MREILFRGQTRKNGEKVEMATGEKVPGHWVYGGIFPGTGDYSIIYGGETEKDLERHVVYSETVGQYTGLKDKDGKRIFEGDIIQYCERQFDGKDSTICDVVVYTEGGFAVKSYFLNNWLWDSVHGNIQLLDVEVIGNIHDNPELLKGGEGL